MLDTALHLNVVLCVVCEEPTTSVEVWTPELSTEPESLITCLLPVCIGLIQKTHDSLTS